MKTLSFLATAALSLGLFAPGALQAQNEKAGGPSTTVTGCLSQGDEANEYAIKDSSGKTYGLFAATGVNLKAHVGHTVTVTGTPEPAGREKKNAKAESKEESEHLRVSDLKMVSTSCK
jgi:hypothetical protein